MYGIISVETIAPGRSAMCSNADVLCIITFLVIVLVFFFFSCKGGEEEGQGCMKSSFCPLIQSFAENYKIERTN